MDNWRIILYEIIENCVKTAGVKRFSTWNSQDEDDTNDAHLAVSNAFFEINEGEQTFIFGSGIDTKNIENKVKFTVHILMKNSGVNQDKQKEIFIFADKICEEIIRYSGSEFLQFRKIDEKQDTKHTGKLTYPLTFETVFSTIHEQNKFEKTLVIKINNSVEIKN